MKAAVLVVALVAAAAPAAAQSSMFGPAEDAPAISLRPFVDVRAERFTASQTFDAIFGQSTSPFWGGGVQVVLWRGRVYAEVGASCVLRANGELLGERVFVTSDRQVFRLGIPLRATITPLEIAAGYRFNQWRRVVPYAGAGFGSYHYTEASDFANPSENLDVTKNGALFQGGAELRVGRWIGVAGEAQYTHVPGILGTGGVSEQFAQGIQGANARKGEADLGGWAARFKLVVGR